MAKKTFVPSQLRGIQAVPDWNMCRTAKQLEEELINFKYAGPGFYLTDQDTLLVIPADREHGLRFWSIGTSNLEERFYLLVFNVPFRETIFAAMGGAPTRKDDRSQ